MSRLHALNPTEIWSYFEKICEVPRASGKEDKIRQFLMDFAARHNLTSKTDKAGNLLISKPAAKGREGAPVVVLQTHMDMVCEKNSDKEFDFDRDAIEPLIKGEWVKANGTTLGADCGIGIAAQMAVLSSDTIRHGPIECLFTVDEETGLTGAFALEPGFMNGEILLNLDSEDEGEIFIGCAGGIDTLGTFGYEPKPTPRNFFALKISVAGLRGGHSGDDIHKGRGNAIKILTRFLWQAAKEYELEIAAFNGGNLRNAIAREAYAVVALPHKYKEKLIAAFNGFASEIEHEYEKTEATLRLRFESTDLPPFTMDRQSRDLFLHMLYACPHGVLEWSSRMEGMVETSTNLASVKPGDHHSLVITTSQRSEIESRKLDAARMVEAVFSLGKATVVHTDGYPGWTPNPDSDVLKITVDSYQRLFGHKPVVRSIHAGLECGLFLAKYPKLDMVSFGPTIRNAHSPDESLEIATVDKFWQHLKDVLEQIGA
jgi:dipeptidase D